MNRPATIFALASGGTPAALAVLRLSGPDTPRVLKALSGSLPPPRRAVLRAWRDPRNGTILDRGIQLWFPGPASFTGEDMAELHLHGSLAVCQTMAEILSIQGLRPAQSGEFTRRAFAAGRIDPTRIEALADLIAARTEQQRRQALNQMEGGLHDLYTRWRQRIIDLRARVEAGIDFPEDVEDSDIDTNGTLKSLIRDMHRHVQDRRRGEIIRQGFRVVLVGGVNAGKSSLFNRLIERQAAIVSDQAGTTRDVLEASIDIGGHQAILTDTAGFRSGGGAIEREGIRRARQALGHADAAIFLFAPDSSPLFPAVPLGRNLPVLPVLHKSDQGQNPTYRRKIAALIEKKKTWSNSLAVSSIDSKGIDTLSAWIEDRIRRRLDQASGPPPTRPRHHALVRESRDHLRAAVDAEEEELIAEELRAAGDCLGRIVGAIDVEEVLDSLFHGLCIGK